MKSQWRRRGGRDIDNIDKTIKMMMSHVVWQYDIKQWWNWYGNETVLVLMKNNDHDGDVNVVMTNRNMA